MKINISTNSKEYEDRQRAQLMKLAANYGYHAYIERGQLYVKVDDKPVRINSIRDLREIVEN